MNKPLGLFNMKYVKVSQVHEHMVLHELGIANSQMTLLHWVYQTVFRTGASYRAEQVLATDWSDKKHKSKTYWESWQNEPYQFK